MNNKQNSEVIIFTKTNNDINEVVDSNLRVAGELGNLKLMVGSVMGWFKANGGKNARDLYDYLKETNNPYSLVAKNFNPEAEKDNTLFLPNDPTNHAKYEMILSFIKNREQDMGDLTVEQNEGRLAEAGFRCHKSIFGKINMKADMDKSDLANNNLLIGTADIDKVLKDDMKTAKDNGVEVDPQMVGMAKDGSPIFGWFNKAIGNQAISTVGFMITHDKDGQKVMKNCLINDQSTWKV